MALENPNSAILNKFRILLNKVETPVSSSPSRFTKILRDRNPIKAYARYPIVDHAAFFNSFSLRNVLFFIVFQKMDNDSVQFW